MDNKNLSIALVLILATAVALAVGMGVSTVVDSSPWVNVTIGYGAIGVILLAAAALYSVIRRSRILEARMHAIVERAADGIITTDEWGHVETFNKAAEKIFGYRKLELGRSLITILFSSAYSEEEDGDLWDFLRLNAIQATGSAHEVIGLRKDGTRFFMDLSISNAQVGERIIFVAIVRDVTQRKKAQIELKKASEELEVRVEQRTADLRRTNTQLAAEIVERKRTESEREMVVAELQKALAEIKTLTGLVPICASCKKVRDDDGYWNQIEVYIKERSDAEFSHGICPECIEKLYPELSESS